MKYKYICCYKECPYLKEKDFNRCKFTKKEVKELEDYNQEICKGGCGAKCSDLQEIERRIDDTKR